MIRFGFLKQKFTDHSGSTSEDDDQLIQIAAQIVKIHPQGIEPTPVSGRTSVFYEALIFRGLDFTHQ